MPSISCVACGSTDGKFYPAKASSFFEKRLGLGDIEFMRCKRCGSETFPRLTNEQMDRIYRDYREPSYNVDKYAGGPDGSFNYSPEYIAVKQGLILDTLKAAGVSISDVAGCWLDYGGDRGQNIPSIVKDKNIYDASNVQPFPGVHKFATLEDAWTKRYDVIVCAQTLEHLPYPEEVLHNIVSLTDRDTLIYIEVPDQSSFLPARSSLHFLTRYPLFVRAEAAITGQHIVMDEHINKFSTKGMVALLERSGLVIEQLRHARIRAGLEDGQHIIALCRRSGDIVERGCE